MRGLVCSQGGVSAKHRPSCSLLGAEGIGQGWLPCWQGRPIKQLPPLSLSPLSNPIHASYPARQLSKLSQLASWHSSQLYSCKPSTFTQALPRFNRYHFVIKTPLYSLTLGEAHQYIKTVGTSSHTRQRKELPNEKRNPLNNSRQLFNLANRQRKRWNDRATIDKCSDEIH